MSQSNDEKLYTKKTRFISYFKGHFFVEPYHINRVIICINKNNRVQDTLIIRAIFVRYIAFSTSRKGR